MSRMEEVKADSDVLLHIIEQAYGLGPSHAKSVWPLKLRGSPADLADYLARAINSSPERLHRKFTPASIDWDVTAELKKQTDKDKDDNPPVSGAQRLLAALILIKCKAALPLAEIHPGVVTCALKLAADRAQPCKCQSFTISSRSAKLLGTALFDSCPGISNHHATTHH